jgi:hypothetical protein
MIRPANIDLEEFITRWHGFPSVPPEKPTIEDRRLPVALREWYAQSSRWAQPVIKLMRIYSPDQIRRSGDMEIFMEDPSGDWIWAFWRDNKDSIFEAELHGEWSIVEESFSDFIIHCTVIDAAFTASFWRESRHVESGLLDEILAPMSEVSFGKWRWPAPGGRIFISESMIATVMAAPAAYSSREVPEYAEVRVAAIESGQLDYLDGMKSIRWRRYPRILNLRFYSPII